MQRCLREDAISVQWAGCGTSTPSAVNKPMRSVVSFARSTQRPTRSLGYPLLFTRNNKDQATLGTFLYLSSRTPQVLLPGKPHEECRNHGLTRLSSKYKRFRTTSRCSPNYYGFKYTDSIVVLTKQLQKRAFFLALLNFESVKDATSRYHI